MKSLNKISMLSNSVGGASAEVLLLLFKGCVLPLLEYGYSTWCTCNDTTSLESVQHAALTRILGAMEHSSTAAMEVIANVLPLQIRLQVKLVQSFIRIYRKPDNNSLRNKVVQLRLNPQFIMGQRNSPIHMLQLAEMQLADFTVDVVEPAIHETIDDITRKNNMQLIITDQKIGSSGNRTAEQERLAQETALSYITEAGNDAIIFTDGSATPNPGPCGAGICAYWAGITAEPSETAIAVSKHSSSYHGELKAIDAALEMAANRGYQGTLHILSDCQSALKIATSNDISSNFCLLSKNIKENAARINGNIRMIWIAGHASIEGNEKADVLAKEGAASAPGNRDLFVTQISSSEAKTRLNANAVKRWKDRWRRQNTGHCLVQDIDSNRRIRHTYSREVECKVYRMALQHTRLEENMHKMYPAAHPTPACECRQGTGTVDHYLQHCSLYVEQREEMINTIEHEFRRQNTDPNDYDTSTRSLLGLNKAFNPTLQSTIASALSRFLTKTKKPI